MVSRVKKLAEDWKYDAISIVAVASTEFNRIQAIAPEFGIDKTATVLNV